MQTIEYQTITLDAEGRVAARVSCRARCIAQPLSGGIALDLIALPGGSFQMGSPKGGGYDDETPAHHVTVAPFAIGRRPITQEQWQAVMGKCVCRFDGRGLPVENVSWDMASRFCRQLSTRTGRAYRLPSEAQWEYACRAGTSGPFHFGATLTTEVANYNGEFAYRLEPKGVYRHTTTEAGRFPPNAFGLCDMHGNVWEWCADAWRDSYQGAPGDDRAWQPAGRSVFRVARGGSWHDTPQVCRSATRLKVNGSEGDEFTGFRVVCSSP